MKNKSGITLVALVITIIILLILAGVGITALTQTGLLEKAKQAKEITENAQNTENSIFANYSNKIEESIGNSTRGNTNTIEVENLNIEVDKENKNLKYRYEGKEILPIYWYGYEFSINETVGTWHESNNIAKIIKNDNSFTYSAYMSITYSQCVGGLATNSTIDMSKYSKCHIIINKCNVATRMQYISRIGALGSDTVNENRNVILDIPKVENGPIEYVGDISKVTGKYYMGLQSWNPKTEMEVIAWWFE